MTTPIDFRGGGAPTVTHPHPLDNAVHLHSRPHIDLQRVAGALCCS
ncbi:MULTISPECIES: putative leader peptide [Streptomyces]|nr:MULTISPECIES: putative leader peptide [Streptomyces]